MRVVAAGAPGAARTPARAHGAARRLTAGGRTRRAVLAEPFDVLGQVWRDTGRVLRTQTRFRRWAADGTFDRMLPAVQARADAAGASSS